MVEHRTLNPLVQGSSPWSPIIYLFSLSSQEKINQIVFLYITFLCLVFPEIYYTRIAGKNLGF